MKLTYQQAKAAIERAYKAGDISAEEREQKLQKAEKLKQQKPKEKKEKTPAEPKPKKEIAPEIAQCRAVIERFNAKKRAEKAEEARKELLAKAETPEKKEEIKNLSDSEVLAKLNPRPRIDVLTKKELKRLAEKNLKTKLANIPKKDKKDISEENIKEIVNTLYEQLDKLTDKFLR